MLAHGHYQHALAYFALIHRHLPAASVSCRSSCQKCRDNQCRDRPRRNPPSWCKPARALSPAKKEAPPPPPLFRQSRRNLLPHPLPVTLSRVRHRHGVQRLQYRVDAFQLRAAFGAILHVSGDSHAVALLPIVIRNQLFFLRMLHSSVPIARACPRRSTNGSSAFRNFCTDRNTVFFAALVLDFNAPAISSIPDPPQCRITNAVRSAGVSSLKARRMCFASCPLCASRSGFGAASGTVLIKSISTPSSVARAGCSRCDSSLFFCRMRSIA